MKSLRLALSIGFLSTRLLAQQLPPTEISGDKNFSRFNFAQAARYYELVARKNATPAVLRRLAECYRHLRSYDQAEHTYSLLVATQGCNAADHLWYGKALQAGGKYADAKVQFSLVKPDAYTSAETLNTLKESCDLGLTHYKDSPYIIENAAALNTAWSEFAPVRFQQSLVFVSDRPGSILTGKERASGQANSGIAGWTNTAWLDILIQPGSESKARRFSSSLDTRYYNGPCVFTASGKRIYFTRSSADTRTQTGNAPKTVPIRDSAARQLPAIAAGQTRDIYYETAGAGPRSDLNADQPISYINHLELWYADSTASGWQVPKAFPYNAPHVYSIGHPALSPDGTVLYFSSDMPGGEGGFDLYYSILNKDLTFSAPVNLGKMINGPGNEEFPVIEADGTLDFASDGKVGFGGLDIYTSAGGMGTWSLPRNMGPAINSPHDDFGFMRIDAYAGFFASNREGGKGTDDIYSFSIARPVLPVAPVNIHLASLPTVQPDLSPGHLTDVSIPIIHFAVNSAVLSPESTFLLDKVVRLLTAEPDTRMHVASFTDIRGSIMLNIALSQRRTISVLKYLTLHGINGNRLVSSAFEKQTLINKCKIGVVCTDVKHRENRRTELSFVAKEPTL